MEILNDIKPFLGISLNETVFDLEILAYINGVLAEVVQLGAIEFEDIFVDSNTEWPIFGSVIKEQLLKNFLSLKVRTLFDPTTSETVSKAHQGMLADLSGRILIEYSEGETA